MENIFNIGSELSINNACKIKTEIESLMMKYDTLTLISDNISTIDLAGFQLLVATKNHAHILNKKIKFQLKFDDKVREILSKVGFDLVEF